MTSHEHVGWYAERITLDFAGRQTVSTLRERSAERGDDVERFPSS